MNKKQCPYVAYYMVGIEKTVRIKKSMFVEDLDIQAFVDEELPLSDKRFIEQLIKYDPAVGKRVRELRHQNRLLQSLWQEEHENVASN